MRVLIADDEPLIREGLALVLNRNGFLVSETVGNADDLLLAVQNNPPQLVITDIRMPPGMRDEGLVAALTIKKQHPAIAVVVLSQHVQRQYASELIAEPTGGVGYFLKQRVGDIERFCADLRSVAAGATVLDPEIVAVMGAQARRRGLTAGELTRRQQEVIELMAQGISNAGIASALHLTERSVTGHISRIYEVFGLNVEDDMHRRVLAVTRYLMK
ncbi:response regulator transcription factor [Leifsonia kafniensis]|uniref:Response regulator transcription factor n=1 Tax=Leifsonia kafniensis TaxID=475957 RepID=A0ABP7KX18_9MICO